MDVAVASTDKLSQADSNDQYFLTAQPSFETQKHECASIGKDDGSPDRPDCNEANVPEENANRNISLVSDSDCALSSYPVSTLTGCSESPSEVMITKNIVNEEKNLEQEAEQKEEEELRKRKEEWMHLSEDTKEMRYLRLQCLLMKSNMYTEYLLHRMEKQREDEKERRAKLAKKSTKEEKAKQNNCAEKIVEVKNEIQETKEENTEANKLQEEVSQNSQDSTPSTSTAPKRTKVTLRAPVAKSQLSSPTLSQTNSTPKTPGSPSVKVPEIESANTDASTSQTKTVVERSQNQEMNTHCEITCEKLTDSQDFEEKENKTCSGGGRSTRGRRSHMTPNTEDSEDSHGRYQNNTLNPVEDTKSRKGRKRKHCDYNEQSPEGARLLTHCFESTSKRRRNEKGATDKEGSSDKTVMALDKRLAVASSLKIMTKIHVFDGMPEIGEDGLIIRPALFTGGVLRQYQVEGLNWLKMLFENGVNGMLADEMGLGKTIQCVALMCQIVTMGAPGPFLIVAPLSTLPNWKAEFKKFAPRLPVVFYHGKKEERMIIRRQIFKKHEIMKSIFIQPIVITSYEIAMKDRPLLNNFDWTYMVVDEGHRIKNKNCRLIRELKQYQTSNRLLLTGTPLQNNLRELWSLLNFLLPEIFDDLGSFEMWFDVEIMSEESADEAIIEEERKKNILSMLHQILTPFMLRRVKSDVDLEIPPKKELLVYCPLTDVQREFYQSTVDKTILKKIEERNYGKNDAEAFSEGRPKRRVASKKVDYKMMMETANDSIMPANKKKDEEELETWIEAMIEYNKPVEKLEKVKVSEVTVRLQNIMMQLRKVCNHPYLLEYPLDVKTGQYKIDEDLVLKCGKMKMLDRMLPALLKKGHKMLIFSQMTRMLDILEDYLIIRKIDYCRLDGSCGVDDRQESMDRFNCDPTVNVFLLSTRAGGLGINLIAADTVIIYDSDWNPQSDLQAQDRCHRIGQTKPVVVYRLVTANTIDQKIVERAAAKRKLEKMVILKGKFKTGIYSNFSTELKPLCPKELMELLKSKDHCGIIDQAKDGEVINQADLEILLDRSDMVAEHAKNRKVVTGKSEQDTAVLSLLQKDSKESPKLFQLIEYDTGCSTLDEKHLEDVTTR